MLIQLKEFLANNKLKKSIDSSMGLKFVVALAAVIFVLMLIGTAIVVRMQMKGQARGVETRGHELGLFIGKAGTDALLRGDIAALDGLVTEAVRSKDVIYAYVTDGANKSLNSVNVSFNRQDPEVGAMMSSGKADGVVALAARARRELDPIETKSDIMVGATRVGTVHMGFSRQWIRDEARQVLLLLFGASLVIVIALSGLLSFMVRRMIVVPTTEAVVVASNIASGDLTQSVRIRSVDELGMLGRGLNRMIIGLKGMIWNVRESARNMESFRGELSKTAERITSGSRVQSESVEEAASSVNEMHYALKEIGGNMDDLHETSERTSSSVIELVASVTEVAQSMVDLAASIEETSSAITQMSAAISQIAENVDGLSSAAEQTSASSTQISASVKEVESAARESAVIAEAVAADAQQLGMTAIAKTIEGMGRIEANTKHTTEVVNRLGDRAENIGGILTVIEDITDQTGLLALNAAILAAQAGEHGKGFAVVAAEIRELANRTAASTQEIAALIASVQEETRQTVEAMHEGDAIVREGVRLATDAGDALRKILEQTGTSRDMSRTISRAAAEQARGIKQVSEAMQQVNRMAHQFANAANQQKAGSEQIMRAAEKMQSLTRFVSSAVAEQAKAGKDITAAVAQMNSKISMVNRATGEVQSGSDLIVKAIDRIKAITKTNVELAAGLNGSMEVMSSQAGALSKEIGKFNVGS